MADHTEHSGLLGIGESEFEELSLSEQLRWLRQRIGKFVKGGIYLLAGQPGIGKSTLAIQLAVDLARAGSRTLYILTEQSKEELAQRARLITSNWTAAAVVESLKRVEPEDGVYDIETLPSFLSHQVMSPSGKYHGASFIVLDSVQGHGLAATATRKYRQVYEFCRQCKSAGITVLLVAHVTKRGEIAGPKDLEHNVDCVLVMRKAMTYRPLFVPKNRFGPAVLKPVPLEMDKNSTALSLAPHSEAVSTVARSFLGRDFSLPEVQASVSLPTYGGRGRITAPGLPRREIEQLANCISQIPDMNIDDLDYTIHCRLPGGRRYHNFLGLPLSVALIASYLQKDIPAHHLYIGEIDLLRKVREVPDHLVTQLWEAIQANEIRRPLRLFLPPESARLLRETLEGVTVVACDRLDDAVFLTWPELRQSDNGGTT
jgi:DNA repair protein RadA/Sms